MNHSERKAIAERLDKEIEFYRGMSNHAVYSGSQVANIIEHWKGRLFADMPDRPDQHAGMQD